jgi:hypothetical protein
MGDTYQGPHAGRHIHSAAAVLRVTARNGDCKLRGAVSPLRAASGAELPVKCLNRGQRGSSRSPAPTHLPLCQLCWKPARLPGHHLPACPPACLPAGAWCGWPAAGLAAPGGHVQRGAAGPGAAGQDSAAGAAGRAHPGGRSRRAREAGRGQGRCGALRCLACAAHMPLGCDMGSGMRAGGRCGSQHPVAASLPARGRAWLAGWEVGMGAGSGRGPLHPALLTAPSLATMLVLLDALAALPYVHGDCRQSLSLQQH